MPKKKKRFIDKKNAVTYHLIHRSQKDPLQADENAPQRVLVSNDELSQANRKERLTTMGIYYDDDYDYEQHLRDVEDLNMVQPDINLDDLDCFRLGASAKSKVQLPQEVLPSVVEEKIGMLELAAPVSGPKLDWDPDIVAALDSDNDEPMDADLEDDFINLANQEGDEDELYLDDGAGLNDRRKQWLAEQMQLNSGLDVDYSDMPPLENDEGGDTHSDAEAEFSDSEEDNDDEVGSLPSFSDEETKTRFTNYSMSSSVIRRNQGLTLVDDKFEQMYAEYDDDEIGALDHEDIEGKVSTNGPMMEFLLAQFEKQKLKERSWPEHEDQKDRIEIVSDTESDDDGAPDEDLVKVVIDEQQKWDCESILSTYSNLYNHPKVIDEPWRKDRTGKIELTKKLGIPKESLQSKGLTQKQLKELDKESLPVKSTPVRRKEETPEEKKARKSAVKLERKDRRIEKKNTKLAFKQEEATQRRQNMEAKNNRPGDRLI